MPLVMFSGCAPTDRFFENVLRLLVVGACPRLERKKLILSARTRFGMLGLLIEAR